jgi:hypothetical protein
MKSRARSTAVRLIGTFVVALVTLTFLGGCQNRVDKDEEHPKNQEKKASAQITVENGQTLIALDTPTQDRLGLKVATLASTVTRAQAMFPAVVLAIQDLATSRNAFVGTQAQLQRARVQADVAGKEYTRLKTLLGENQNISEKSLQSAEGTLQSDEVDVHAAEQELTLQESGVQQAWGDVVTKWATEGSAQFQRVLDQHELLVQMTIPSGTSFGAPKTISLEIPGGSRTQASFVSPFPRVDPRIQGRSFLYLASAQPGLAPGLNLVARLSVGSQLKGVVIPTSAVVWSEGKAWVYAQVSSEQFTRRPVSTDVPVENGFFVGEGFSPGDKVVISGAQTMLSEEMLLHGQAGGESDEN